MNNISGIDNLFEPLSVIEKGSVYEQVAELIDLMDDKAINEFLQNSTRDVFDLFDIILEETYNILNLKKYNSLINNQNLSLVPNIKSGFEEYLRKQNLTYFVHSVLPEFEINWHCMEWFSMIQIYRLLCLIAARDHSKSFSISFAYVLWRLYRFTRATQTLVPPDDIKFYREGALITNEFKLAKKLLKKVKEEIQNNSILNEALYPDKNLGGWAQESIICKNGSEMFLSSFRTSNRGPHPGWIVVDDFLDKSAMFSAAQREKFKEVFKAEIMNMLLPQGQCITVGTPFHACDLYSDLKNDPDWKVFEYPAVWPDGSLLWENRYNFEALKKKRASLGSLIFSREILCRPVSDDTTIFPWKLLENAFINSGNLVIVENRQSFPIKLKKVCIGVDWAISG